MKAETCRMCGGSNLRQWLDLGHQPHSDQFKKSKEEAEQTYPLGVSVCECGLNQLTYVVAKEELYLKDYLYESSITKTASDHWEEFAQTVSATVGLSPKDSFVVDIGSNDGTLLSKFSKLPVKKVLGFDPTPEATEIAIKKGIETIQKFFTLENAKNSEQEIPKNSADLVLGTNVFAHIHDMDDFMLGVKHILNPKGAFVFESPYFGEFLKGLEYDTVYHQHLSYLSLKPLVHFLEKHGMEVFNVEQRPLHGGVFRVYIARKGTFDVQSSVYAMLQSENWTLRDLLHFARQVEENRDNLYDMMHNLKRRGKTIAVVSTPAKGNTLLNYTGVGRFIDFATDKSILKQGRFTPGTFIPVFSDEKLLTSQPDYALVLAWNFFSEITENVRNAGFKGRFIRPLPNVEVYG